MYVCLILQLKQLISLMHCVLNCAMTRKSYGVGVNEMVYYSAKIYFACSMQRLAHVLYNMIATLGTVTCTSQHQLQAVIIVR